MAEVKLENLKKIYDKNVVAVQEFSLDIADKEFIVLVGPSGCGKSTTLRMIAGLEDISSGDLYINGKIMNDIAPKDRDIAMVFQNYALYPHMSVYDNMAFALKLRKLPKDQIQEKVFEAAEILGITELLNRRPKALSGGQRQRVAIGRAIVRNPQVFLMDEPLSNLDAKLRTQMRAELIKLRQRIDTTFIYVTHDQTEAMTLGDRIVIMKDGFIQQIGTPHEVYNHPANQFVAGFIGSPRMNFFDAQLRKEQGRFTAYISDTAIELPEEGLEALHAGETDMDVVLGIRPEHIQLIREADAGSITAVVDVTEMMGNEVFIHMNVYGADTIIRVQSIDLLNEGNNIKYKQPLSFRFPPKLIHVFDRKTGLNLC